MKYSSIAWMGLSLIFIECLSRPEGPISWLGYLGIVATLFGAVPFIFGSRRNV